MYADIFIGKMVLCRKGGEDAINHQLIITEKIRTWKIPIWKNR